MSESSASSDEMRAWPRRVGTFLDLIKFAHSIFALPFALVATFMAARSAGRWFPTVGQLGLILVCMVAARTFAMTVNRLADRGFDRLNPRTARRPSVTGAVSPGFMKGAIVLSAALFGLGAAGFAVFYGNVWPAVLAAPVLVWLGLYSFTKRFTALCHFWLGVSLGLAPVSAWLALGPPRAAAWNGAVMLLGAAVTLWVAGFDILYALQDEEIDRAAGLRSIPARVGRGRALGISRACHAGAALALAGVGVLGGFHGLYWTGFAAATLLLAAEQSLVSERDISRVNVAFMTVNGLVGLVFGAMAIGDLFWFGGR